MNTLNLAEALVQGYAYNEMMGDDDKPKMSGGYPIQSLVDNHTYNVQRGGAVTKMNGYTLHDLGNKAIPIGLVYQPSENKLNYAGGHVQSDVDAPVISNELYDKLLGGVSMPYPSSSSSKFTRKNAK